MKVVRPIKIKPENYFRVGTWDSDPIMSYFPWSPGFYDANTEVVYEGFIYKNPVAILVTDPPSVQSAVPSDSPQLWTLIGVLPSHSPFDNQTSTAATMEYSTFYDPAEYIINWTRPAVPTVDTIGLFNLENCERVVVQITRTGLEGQVTTTYEKSLVTNFIGDWYDYFFAESEVLSEAIFEGIPPTLDEDLEIRLTFYPDQSRVPSFAGEFFTMSAGSIVIGKSVTIGQTQLGPKSGIIDYSRKETDEFGRTTFVKRAFSKRASYSVFLPNGELNRVFTLLAKLRATPCVWIGTSSDTYGPLNVFGYYRDFNIDIQYVNHSLVSIDVEGLA